MVRCLAEIDLAEIAFNKQQYIGSRKELAVRTAISMTDRRATSGKVRHWLVKSEPHVFSIDDLAGAANQTTYWDGVRNYQARNMLRDAMKVGDQVLFYHSNTESPAIVGLATVAREGYADHTAFDANDIHFDPKSNSENPRWFMVDIRFSSKFTTPLTLEELRKIPALSEMELLRRGSRLSVQPVRPAEFATIMKLAKR